MSGYFYAWKFHLLDDWWYWIAQAPISHLSEQVWWLLRNRPLYWEQDMAKSKGKGKPMPMPGKGKKGC